MSNTEENFELDADFSGEEGEEDIDLGGMDMDFGDLLGEYFASEDGVTVGDSILKMVQTMEIQNKILVKILTALSSK